MISMNGQVPEMLKMSFGPLLDERKYKVGFSSIFWFLVAIAFTVFGVIKVFSSLQLLWFSMYFSRFFSHDYWIFFAMMIGGIIRMLVTIRSWIVERRSSFEVFEKGFYVKSWGKEFAFSYTDIQNLWIQMTNHYTNGVKTDTSIASSLETVNGDRIDFNLNHFPKKVDITNFLLNTYEKLRFADVKEYFQEGKPQQFWPITLTATWIETKKGMLPWNELLSVETVASGFNVRFKTIDKKTFDTYAWRDIPNRGIFLDLIISKNPEVEFKS